MNIVCVLGSPRKKGDSASIAARFCDAASARGADVATHVLNDLTYKGCQGCMACKTRSETCVVEDDLAGVLDAAAAADVLVLTSPVYVGEVTGQLKCLFDRMFSYLVPDFFTAARKTRLEPGKKLVFIVTQGDPDESHYGDLFSRYEGFMKSVGFEDITRIRACGTSGSGAEAVMSRARQEADEAAERLFG
jgi:multimeric flavodoxin WrbA